MGYENEAIHYSSKQISTRSTYVLNMLQLYHTRPPIMLCFCNISIVIPSLTITYQTMAYESAIFVQSRTPVRTPNSPPDMMKVWNEKNANDMRIEEQFWGAGEKFPTPLKKRDTGMKKWVY